MRLKNDFSWSFSRAGTFSECQKKYWYTYYGSWEGWPKTPRDERPSIDPLSSYLYTLKQMQQIPTFVGSCVHTAIEQFLKKRQPRRSQDLGLFDEEELLLAGQKLFDQGIQDAKSQAWRKSPKKHTLLFELYYGEDIAPDALTAAKAKVEHCLKNWYASPIVEQLAFHKNSSWLTIEELSSFQLDNRFKIIVVIDFAIKWQTNVALLFDWKTGEESSKTEDQLYCYALFAHRVWGFPLDRIVLVPFYLFKNSYSKIGFQQKQPLSLDKIRQVENEMRASCQTMSSLHQVEPRPDPKLFAYTDDRKKCLLCPFKELCTKVNYENLGEPELRDAILSQKS